MSKKQKIQTRLSGRNIYTDKKNRTIYYDIWTKRGYVVEPKLENKITFYKNRLVIILFAAILCAGTFLSAQQSAVAGVIFFVLVELLYRVRVFKKMQVAEDFDRGRRITPLESILAHKSKEKVVMLAILYAAFAVLVMLNAFDQHYTSALMLLSVGGAVLGIYFCALHVIALTKMK